MSKYTTELRWLIENNFDIGLKTYPIFDEKYRTTLNNKIINHYKFREIGFETAALFAHFMRTRMNEIMPLYNRKYKLLFPDTQENMFVNTDYSENYTKDRDVTNTGKTQSKASTSATGNTTDKTSSNTDQTTNTKDIYSDTPQGLLSNPSITADTYATNATIGENTSNQSSTSNSTGTSEADTSSSSTVDMTNKGDETENYLRKVLGNQGGKYKYEMMYDLAERMFDIDLMIINDLSDLFMMVY